MHANTDQYISDFPGWSAYAYKNCPGHDIHNEITDTLYECIDRCISHPDCVAVLFLPPGQCYLKSACEQLISVASNIDLFAYRMLGKFFHIFGGGWVGDFLSSGFLAVCYHRFLYLLHSLIIIALLLVFIAVTIYVEIAEKSQLKNYNIRCTNTYGR